LQRWVWLEVAEPQLPQAPIDFQYRGPATPKFNRHYIPEEIIAHIPIYQIQLHEILALIEGDTEPIIRDDVARKPELVCKTIRFLASGYLTPVGDGEKESEGTWDSLVGLYNFSRLLSIKTLEVAMLTKFCDLIDALSPTVFLTFARRYYNETGRYPKESSTLGCLIKVKLAEFLPRLQQTMTIKVISSQGGILGTQLIEVLLENRAKNQVAPGSGARTKVENQR
jgi:hypothetical protein